MIMNTLFIVFLALGLTALFFLVTDLTLRAAESRLRRIDHSQKKYLSDSELRDHGEL